MPLLTSAACTSSQVVGRSRTNKIPRENFPYARAAPSFDIPPCNPSECPARPLAVLLLGRHSRQSHRRSFVGDTPEPLLGRSRGMLFPPVPHALWVWTLSVPHDDQTDQHRRSRRGPGWQVWGHFARRCVDVVCQSAGGSLRFVVHVFHPWAQFDGTT